MCDEGGSILSAAGAKGSVTALTKNSIRGCNVLGSQTVSQQVKKWGDRQRRVLAYRPNSLMSHLLEVSAQVDHLKVNLYTLAMLFLSCSRLAHMSSPRGLCNHVTRNPMTWRGWQLTPEVRPRRVSRTKETLSLELRLWPLTSGLRAWVVEWLHKSLKKTLNQFLRTTNDSVVTEK